ncbi:tetratricopeptide repeat protein [Sphingobacteriales bacterium UPWRP_1]|nr:hypothetical protein B6N25_10260 [Sphingobacteriales bacterium TSM_CSS]PSJ73832.1 tetratricopeptide repeat protein [Sphingobacteriales bacterium UPWRP_1]
MFKTYTLLFLTLLSVFGICAGNIAFAQDFNYYGAEDTSLLQPSKQKKQKKKKKEPVAQPYGDETQDAGGVLQNPSGFEMYGTEPSAPVQPETVTPPTEQNLPSEMPEKSAKKTTKAKKEKKNKDGAASNTGDTDVINLNLDVLYQVNFTDTVIVQDKRVEAPQISFKAQEDVKYYYNQAVMKVNNNDYEAAIELLNKCIARDPSNKDVLQMRANCYTEMKKFKLAIKDYNKAIKLDSKDPILQYNKGSTLIKMGKFDDAIETFTKAVQYKPDYVYALQGRASAKTLKGDYDSAIEDYSLVLDQNPLFIAALKGRGVAKGLLRRYDDAINDFTAVIELQPTDGMSYYYRGLAYISLNQPYKGCSDFDRAYQLNVRQAYFDIKEYCR